MRCLHKTVVLLLVPFSCANFAAQYFSEYRRVNRVVIKTNDIDAFETAKELNCLSIFVAADLTALLGPSGVFMNCDHSCDVSSSELFNRSYYWLIVGDHELLSPNVGVRLDSQITVLERAQNGSFLALDVYSLGRHRKWALEVRRIGTLSLEMKWKLDKLPPLWSQQYRGNLQGLGLRTAIPIGYKVDNWDVSTFDKAFSSRGSSFETLCMIKFNHAINMILRERFNFRMVVNRVPRDINGKVRELRGGALGILARNETDIISAGALVRACRLKEFDYIHSRLYLRVDLYYRLTPDLVLEDTETFAAPLDSASWMAYLLILVCIFACLRLQGTTPLLSVWHIIHVTSVQSFSSVSKHRIITLTCLFFVVIFFNLYSTSLLQIILTPPLDTFKTAADVLNALFITRVDINFVKISVHLAAVASNRTFSESYFHGITPQAQPRTSLTVFQDGIAGLQAMRRGHTAFAAETPTINYVIRSQLSPEEICEVRSKTVMNDQLYYVLRRRSEYSEMFKVGLMHMDEAGLVIKARQHYLTEFPPCSVPVTVYSVPLWKIWKAFEVLIGGAAISLAVLLLECFTHKIFRLTIRILRRAAKTKITDRNLLQLTHTN